MDNEIQCIAALVSAPRGFGVDLFRELSIYRLEDGRFSVSEFNLQGDHLTEELFDSAEEAAKEFLKIAEAKNLFLDDKQNA